MSNLAERIHERRQLNGINSKDHSTIDCPRGETWPFLAFPHNGAAFKQLPRATDYRSTRILTETCNTSDSYTGSHREFGSFRGRFSSYGSSTRGKTAKSYWNCLLKQA